MNNLERNMSVIRRRWPTVATALEAAPLDGIFWQDGTKEGTLVYQGKRMTSSHNRAAEALIQASTVPEGTDMQWCFGTGLGELPRELLKRNKKTAVVVMNASVTRAALEQTYQADWLEHKKVNVCMAVDVAPSINIPANAPFTVVPMEVRFADKDAYPVRDALFGAINTRFNVGIQYRAQLENDTANWEGNKQFMATDARVTELFGSRPGGDFIVCASGPSIDGQMEWLREHGKNATVMCVNSALKPLVKGGVMPSFCVVIDSAEVVAGAVHELPIDPLAACALVYEPVVTPALVSAWPGKRYYAVTRDMWSQGTVTHAMIDLAVSMGAKTITMLGVDFCHPKMKSHAVDAPDHYDVKGDIPAAMMPTVDGNGEETHTIPCHAMYHRNLEQYIKGKPEVQWFKRGREGVTVRGATWLD